MPGLIAGALGGAAAAGEQYLTRSALIAQQGEQAFDLEKVRNEMTATREKTLQGLRGSQEKERQTADITSREKIAASGQKISQEHLDL